MSYEWVARDLLFFPSCMIDEYKSLGWDLSDSITVSDEVFDSIRNAPEGKVVGVDDNGMPCLVDIPPPSHSDLVAQAESQKSALIAEASGEISILSDAVEFDMATPEEILRYNALRKYRVELNRVDTSTAPDVSWPQKP